MAYDLQKLTPTHMLHAGRYSALGQDVESNGTLLPESQVRGKVWREWLPDIYLNPHGYPSHEWVQQFAGYVPPGFRTYWSTRGWYTNLSGVRDPREPDLIQATEALREDIVKQINGNPDVRAMNVRSQARYRKWAYGFSPSVYGQEIYKDTAIYYSDPETGEARGNRRIPTAGGRGGGGPAMDQDPPGAFHIALTAAPDRTPPAGRSRWASAARRGHVRLDARRIRRHALRAGAPVRAGGPQPDERPGRLPGIGDARRGRRRRRRVRLVRRSLRPDPRADVQRDAL